MSSNSIVVEHLTHEKVYSDVALVRRLRFLTNGGWGRAEIGSAMLDDLESKRHGDFFLAKDAQLVIGWAFVTRRERWFSWDEANNGARAEGLPNLYQIGVYVSAKMRRSGVGTKLVERALCSFPKEHLVSCPWNDAGIRLFSRFGLRREEDWCIAYRFRHDV